MQTDINDVTIGQAREMAAVLSGSPPTQRPHLMVGRICLIRTYSAGVHVGLVRHMDGREVQIEGARRIWKWSGAFSLSEVSQNGIKKEGSRVGCSVPGMVLTEAIEVIPVTTRAWESINACSE